MSRQQPAALRNGYEQECKKIGISTELQWGTDFLLSIRFFTAAYFSNDPLNPPDKPLHKPVICVKVVVVKHFCETL